ncbi:MAG: hypothetical protein CME71_07315 [Halobacteriovorax sp.]|nr:hypothetical protein [Halobacteriovorax sp.]
MTTIKEISLNSPLRSLSKRVTKTIEALESTGVASIFDLMWLLPLRVHKVPPIQPISMAKDNTYFRGSGKVASFQSRPNFRAKGKNRVALSNLTIIVCDRDNQESIQLKWFNCYPSVVQKLQSLDSISFAGVIQSFQGNLQIVSPETSDIESLDAKNFIIQYPTVAGVSSTNLKKLIDKIPESLWHSADVSIPIPSDLPGLMEALRFLHAKVSPEKWHEDAKTKARKALAYYEFFFEQIKHRVRKKKLNQSAAISISNQNSKSDLERFSGFFPYELTCDQTSTLETIFSDLQGPGPMMRMVQGDVGCGKTTVAFCSGLKVIQAGHQVALMAPTESLAQQHFKNLLELSKLANFTPALLLGGFSNSQKTSVLSGLKEGSINFVVGTHSLFQDSVEFKSLGLAIIDEQHKFGVNQRIKLVGKTEGAHCLLMSATPIPRSLSLTQYGDLEISIIKTLPGHRKGFKTKIITPDTYTKFLSFIKTRLSMGEQAYIVVPAIEESEGMDIANLNETLLRFKKYFPDHEIQGLHGQLKSDEKQAVLNDFTKGDIDLLVSTSVVEVGIDVENATVMAIINPERFGLSSLHQLRGRVGRGTKPGFCFLVCDKIPSVDSLERLRVIESTSDGFKIAEEDLRIRGEGDLFGTSQSGSGGFRRVANIGSDYELLELARSNVEELSLKPDFLNLSYVIAMAQNDHVVYTV